MLFTKKSAGKSPVDWLIVGLGNPGMTYEGTRHNAGISALRVLAQRNGITLNKKQFKSLVGTGEIAGQKVMLCFPQTFMNNSGEAVQEAMAFYKLAFDQLIVISDDISLDVGNVRVRKKGSDGGQKGLRSIIELTGSGEFPRVRIGVGAKPHPAYDLAKWVLSKFSKDEQPLMDDAFDRAARAVECMIENGTEEAMNRFSH